MSFQINDLVWAKMKGFSPWPGRICIPPPSMQQVSKPKVPSKCVFFFGSKDFGYVEDSNIKLYEPNRDETKKSKAGKLKTAIDRIEEYISDPERYKGNAEADTENFGNNNRDIDAEFDKLLEGKEDEVEEEVIVVKPSPRATKKRSVGRPIKFKIGSPDITENKRKSNATESKTNSPAAKKKRLSDDFNDTDRILSHSSALINRPTVVARPDMPEIDLKNMSNTLRLKNIEASILKFGFLGLGIMGSGIVKNLINSGHNVVVWNRTLEKTQRFVEAGAETADTPSDVIEMADVTFSCVSDPQAAKEMVFGNCGVLTTMSSEKGYVEMTTIDAETSQDIAEAITSKGGRYLEAQIQGSKSQADEGTLIILAAGETDLFNECQSCFRAMGKNSFFLGEVGNASKMNLVLQMMSGITLGALAESMALADRAGLKQQDVLEVLRLTNMNSSLIEEKGKAIIENKYGTHHPLKHMQKDLKLALQLSDSLEQSLPLTSATNEGFKHAKRLGYAEHDSSAIYVKSRF